MIHAEDSVQQAAAYFLRGLARHAEYDYRRAIQFYSHAIELAPYRTDVYLHRAEARFYHGDLSGAADDCHAALRIDPQSASAYLWRARIRKKNLDLRGAMADYQSYLRLCDDQCPEARAQVEQTIRDLRAQLPRTD